MSSNIHFHWDILLQAYTTYSISNPSCYGYHSWKPADRRFDVHLFFLCHVVIYVIHPEKHMCLINLLTCKSNKIRVPPVSPSQECIFSVWLYVKTNKQTKSGVLFSPQNQTGNRQLLSGLWNSVFLNEHVAFSLARKKNPLIFVFVLQTINSIRIFLMIPKVITSPFPSHSGYECVSLWDNNLCCQYLIHKEGKVYKSFLMINHHVFSS